MIIWNRDAGHWEGTVEMPIGSHYRIRILYDGNLCIFRMAVNFNGDVVHCSEYGSMAAAKKDAENAVARAAAFRGLGEPVNE